MFQNNLFQFFPKSNIKKKIKRNFCAFTSLLFVFFSTTSHSLTHISLYLQNALCIFYVLSLFEWWMKTAGLWSVLKFKSLFLFHVTSLSREDQMTFVPECLVWTAELVYKSVLCRATNVGVKELATMAHGVNVRAHDLKEATSKPIHQNASKFELLGLFTKNDVDL